MNADQVGQAYASVAQLYIELFGSSEQVPAHDLATGIDLVPEFITHARATHPGCSYELRSMENLDVADHSIAGILAWYSLIHLSPPDLDDVLAEFRRVLAPAGTLVLGLFDGDEVASFDHKVVTAYRWPLDDISERLTRAGFAEVERLRRPGDGAHRPHAAIAAVAIECVR